MYEPKQLSEKNCLYFMVDIIKQLSLSNRSHLNIEEI